MKVSGYLISEFTAIYTTSEESPTTFLTCIMKLAKFI